MTVTAPLGVAPPLDAAEAIARRRATALRGNGLAALSMVIWAAGFPAADALLDTWPPLLLVAARFAVALAALLPFLLVLRGIPRGVAWGPALGAGALGIGGGAIALIYAQAVSDPVTAAVFASVSPITGALVELAYRERRLHRGFLLGAGLSVLGGIVATVGSGLPQGALLAGAAFAVVSCILYSWGSHQTVRLMPGQPVLAQTTVSIGGAALGTLALALALEGGAGLPGAVWSGAGWDDAGLLALYGIGGMAVSQLLFVGAVGRIGVALASFHINVAPFYVMLILLALGGGWDWWQAAGAGVVALGVLVAQRA